MRVAFANDRCVIREAGWSVWWHGLLTVLARGRRHRDIDRLAAELGCDAGGNIMAGKLRQALEKVDELLAGATPPQ